MSAQSLKLLRGFGSFILSGSELTPDVAVGTPYNRIAGSFDFTTRSAGQQQMLYATNHAVSPQQTSPTVAFAYTDGVADDTIDGFVTTNAFAALASVSGVSATREFHLSHDNNDPVYGSNDYSAGTNFHITVPAMTSGLTYTLGGSASFAYAVYSKPSGGGSITATISGSGVTINTASAVVSLSGLGTGSRILDRVEFSLVIGGVTTIVSTWYPHGHPALANAVATLAASKILELQINPTFPAGALIAIEGELPTYSGITISPDWETGADSLWGTGASTTRTHEFLVYVGPSNLPLSTISDSMMTRISTADPSFSGFGGRSCFRVTGLVPSGGEIPQSVYVKYDPTGVLFGGPYGVAVYNVTAAPPTGVAYTLGTHSTSAQFY